MHNARYGPGEEYNLIPYPISCKPHVLVFRGMNQTFRLDPDYRVRRLSVRFSALGRNTSPHAVTPYCRTARLPYCPIPFMEEVDHARG